MFRGELRAYNFGNGKERARWAILREDLEPFLLFAVQSGREKEGQQETPSC